MKNTKPSKTEIDAADTLQAPSADKKAIKPKAGKGAKAAKTATVIKSGKKAAAKPAKRVRVSLTNAGVVERRLSKEEGKRFVKMQPDELVGVPMTLLDAAVFPSKIEGYAPSMLFYAEVDAEAFGGELEDGNFITFFLGQDNSRMRIFKALHALPKGQGLGLVTIKLVDTGQIKPYRQLAEWLPEDEHSDEEIPF